VRGTDGGLWHCWWEGAGWRGWETGGGVLKAAPAVASPGPNSLEAVVLGQDDGLYRRRWLASGWTGWDALGGHWSTAPAASAQRGPLIVDVFESSLGNALTHAVLD
jgi:hypothetical protein